MLEYRVTYCNELLFYFNSVISIMFQPENGRKSHIRVDYKVIASPSFFIFSMVATHLPIKIRGAFVISNAHEASIWREIYAIYPGKVKVPRWKILKNSSR